MRVRCFTPCATCGAAPLPMWRRCESSPCHPAWLRFAPCHPGKSAGPQAPHGVKHRTGVTGWRGETRCASSARTVAARMMDDARCARRRCCCASRLRTRRANSEWPAPSPAPLPRPSWCSWATVRSSMRMPPTLPERQAAAGRHPGLRRQSRGAGLWRGAVGLGVRRAISAAPSSAVSGSAREARFVLLTCGAVSERSERSERSELRRTTPRRAAQGESVRSTDRRRYRPPYAEAHRPTPQPGTPRLAPQARMPARRRLPRRARLSQPTARSPSRQSPRRGCAACPARRNRNRRGAPRR